MNKQWLLVGGIVLLFIVSSFVFWKKQSISSGTISNPTMNSSQKTPENSPVVEEEFRVEITDFAFSSPQLTVSKGARVTFVNKGKYPHSATGDTSSFDTGVLASGGEKTIPFMTAGTFTYHCSQHPTMRAQITVTE